MAWVGPVVGGVAGGLGSIGAGKAQASAAEHAADVQKQTSAEALAFQKQQAAQDLANAQAAQLGNYNQWAAKEGRLSNLGEMVGLKPFVIPPYVPIPNALNGPPQAGGRPPIGYRNPNIVSMSDVVQ